MHDIDFGDVLSTLAPVAASVADKKTTKNKNKYSESVNHKREKFNVKRVGIKTIIIIYLKKLTFKK